MSSREYAVVYGSCLECGGHAEEGEDLCWRCMEADMEEDERRERDTEDFQSGADKPPAEPMPSVWVFTDGVTN